MSEMTSQGVDEIQWDKEFELWKEFHQIVFQMTSRDKKKAVDELFEAWRGVFATFQTPPSLGELRLASLEMILDINLDIPWHRHLAFIVAHVKWQRSPETKKLAEVAKANGQSLDQVIIEQVSRIKENLAKQWAIGKP